MNDMNRHTHDRFLIETYFSDPARMLALEKGEFLFRQKQFNDRLFLVKQGRLRGFAVNDGGSEVELFIAEPDMFVGVHSFFSTFTTMTNCVALEDSVISYISYNDAAALAGDSANLAEQFLPVIIHELLLRQRQTMKYAAENEEWLKKLVNSEKLASLGQMAAGIAHELNNAVAVLEKNTHWLSRQAGEVIASRSPDMRHYFAIGLEKGRCLSSRDIRKRQERYRKVLNLSGDAAEMLAHTSIPEDDLLKWPSSLEDDAAAIAAHWETGATLKDMIVSAEHAAHVVRSINALGTSRKKTSEHVDINETIREALSLHQSDLRRVEVDLALSDLPPVYGNAGDFIQIWSNLIKNACESMAQAESSHPRLFLSSKTAGGYVVIAVRDNGPGISPEIRESVFQPNVTTKKEGLSFGLGLGLMIVQRIVDGYNGSITIESEPGNTIFYVKLPCGGNNG